MSGYFIAGAGTDIGKTYVTALLARKIRAAGRPVVALKPVASGVPELESLEFKSTDTATLLDAQGLTITKANVESCSPWRFREPLSPDMAAAAEGRTLDCDALLAWCREKMSAASNNPVLIEGVGGVMSPITSDALNIDLLKALACPVVLVTGSYLGALSHALTALETLKAHGASVLAVVINESAGSTVSLEATFQSLRRFAPGHTFCILARGATKLEIELA